jgi:hypothetical protein
MTIRSRGRRRWTLIPPVIGFGSIEIELTIEEIMADLQVGVGHHGGGADPVEVRDRRTRPQFRRRLTGA